MFCSRAIATYRMTIVPHTTHAPRPVKLKDEQQQG